MFPLFNKRGKEKEEEISSSSFLVNGGLLTEKLITCFNGRYNNPIRNFTAQDLIRATNGFSDRIHIPDHDLEHMFMGSIEQRPILVKDFGNNYSRGSLEWSITDIAVTSQMSHHKNVLKLLGCCLEFKEPAMVYEDTGRIKLLSELLHNREVGINNNVENRSLSWKSRLRIAKDIAGVLLYLHTAFSTPVIYRDLKPSKIIVDDYGVAKLFDFSLCIFLPPGESQVEDNVMGTIGYIDGEYLITGIITEKTDVYSLGMLLVTLLMGVEPRQLEARVREEHYFHEANSENNYCFTDDVFTDYIENHLNEIKDHRITGEGRGFEQEQQQVEDLLALALECIVSRREDRPELIDVAKELTRIERSCVHPY